MRYDHQHFITVHILFLTSLGIQGDIARSFCSTIRMSITPSLNSSLLWGVPFLHHPSPCQLSPWCTGGIAWRHQLPSGSVLLKSRLDRPRLLVILRYDVTSKENLALERPSAACEECYRRLAAIVFQVSWQHHECKIRTQGGREVPRMEPLCVGADQRSITGRPRGGMVRCCQAIFVYLIQNRT